MKPIDAWQIIHGSHHPQISQDTSLGFERTSHVDADGAGAMVSWHSEFPRKQHLEPFGLYWLPTLKTQSCHKKGKAPFPFSAFPHFWPQLPTTSTTKCESWLGARTIVAVAEEVWPALWGVAKLLLCP
jgi:hypothetical protein